MNRQEVVTELWRRGNLKWKLHAGQKRIHETLDNLPGQLRVICCSRQYGKTYFGVAKAISLCLRTPGAKVKIGTAFLSDLSELILPTFEVVLGDCPDDLRPAYRKAGSKWIFKNGAEIKLVGLDKNPNGLRGQVPDLIILEEAGFIDSLEYLYKSVLIPATMHRPDCEIVLISTPPSTPAHAFVDFVQRAKADNAYASFTIYDNPMVDEETIERLARESGGMGSTTWRREYLCEFVLDDDLALCREWDSSFCQEVPRDEYFQHYHKLVGQDLGRKDHTALVFGYYDFKRAALVIEDELTMEGPTWTTKTLRDAVRQKEWELWGGPEPYRIKDVNEPETQAAPTFRRVSDNNNPHLVVDLGSLHNLHFMQVKKDSSLEQMVNRVREWVKQGRILIHPRCKMLIGCLQFGIWDKNRREFARSKVYGHFDHFAALMYLLIHTPAHTNPIPADHGFVNHRAWLHNVKDKKTPNAQAFEALYGPNKKTKPAATPESLRSIVKDVAKTKR